MEATTEQVLRALGSEDGYPLVRLLLEREQTFTQLRRTAGLSGTAATAALDSLRMLGIVQKGRGAQAAWRIEHWDQTLAVIEAASARATSIHAARDEAQRDDAEELTRLRGRGSAQPPPARGRSARDG
jgi:DNA-binding MarR family transcriptional regulator